VIGSEIPMGGGSSIAMGNSVQLSMGAAPSRSVLPSALSGQWYSRRLWWMREGTAAATGVEADECKVPYRRTTGATSWHMPCAAHRSTGQMRVQFCALACHATASVARL
jgi:hypothetical protein